MPRTRGESLRYAIAFALIRARKIVRGLKEGLTEEERYGVADRAVLELKKYGDSWRLDEEWPHKGAAHSPPPMTTDKPAT